MTRHPHAIESLPILILFPHSRCNCRCVMCDIWKITTAEEISAAELERHAADITALGVRWVVFSGGEPLMHSDLFRLANVLRSLHIRTSLLTTGLLLEKNAHSVAGTIDDVIVSLDGPPGIHDKIRRVRGAFEQLQAGVQALQRLRAEYPVTARCTVQRANHQNLCQTVETARLLGIQGVSFLAADVSSPAFNRPNGWPPDRQAEIALAPQEIDDLEGEIERLIRTRKSDIESGYIRESPEKLRRIAGHFRAHLGLADPIAPRCNAPWVSAVIETDGVLRPCFFHQAIGNVKRQSLREALNSPEALAFRGSLDVKSNPTCRRCTCSLFLANEA